MPFLDRWRKQIFSMAYLRTLCYINAQWLANKSHVTCKMWNDALFNRSYAAICLWHCALQQISPLSKILQNQIFNVLINKYDIGREPCSSGYGMRCTEGHGFESLHCILDGHFSHIFVVKIVMFEKTKFNEKEAEDGLFKKPSLTYQAWSLLGNLL